MSDRESSLSEPETLESTQSAGQILNSARKSYEISVEEVAKSLNLSTDAIKALEQDRHELLPGSTFVKGYIRSYANLLDLDPDAVLANVDIAPEKLGEMPAARGPIKIKHKTKKKKGKGGKGKFIFKSFMFIVLLAGLVLFGLNQYSNMDKEKVAEFLKLPSLGSSTGSDQDGDEIVFPDTGSTETGAGQKKEALIRIE